MITDEAHRSQYDVLALNMRNALPHAAYIAFTGTPLIAGEERARQVFGDYVSVYKCDAVYRHVYDSYFGEGRSIYALAA